MGWFSFNSSIGLLINLSEVMNPKTISAKSLDLWLNDHSDKPFLIDVRELEELRIAPFPSSILHLALSERSLWVDTLSKQLPPGRSIVVICHRGIRSWNFGIWLLQHSFSDDVWNLEGGIDAWSIEVDSQVPRY